MSASPKLPVLFATSEVAPLIKTGGLADVAGALPAALMHAGLDVRVLIPGYRQVLAGHARQGTTARNYEHLSPDYLRDAIAQIDAFFDELAKHTKAHLRYARDTQLELELAA